MAGHSRRARYPLAAWNLDKGARGKRHGGRLDAIQAGCPDDLRWGKSTKIAALGPHPGLYGLLLGEQIQQIVAEPLQPVQARTGLVLWERDVVAPAAEGTSIDRQRGDEIGVGECQIMLKPGEDFTKTYDGPDRFL